MSLLALRDEWLGPFEAVGAANVHAAIPMPAAGTTLVVTGITNPSQARTLQIVRAGAGAPGGNVTIAGLNQFGAVVSEVIGVPAAPFTVANGFQPFASIASIEVPTRDAADDTISVGLWSGVGCHRPLALSGFIGAERINATAPDATPPVPRGAPLSSITFNAVSFDPAADYEGFYFF